MTTLRRVQAFEVYDARGWPTVAVYAQDQQGRVVRAICPSGASTGDHEARVGLDGGSRLHGKGVRELIRRFNQQIQDERPDLSSLQSLLAYEQSWIAKAGGPLKTQIPANLLLPWSQVLYQAYALIHQQEVWQVIAQAAQHFQVPGQPKMPKLCMNILNGGCHADNPLDIQEFMICPQGAQTLEQALEWGSACYHRLKMCLKASGYSTNVGDEGGFAPALASTEEACHLLVQACTDIGLRLPQDMALALDCAASHFYHVESGQYYYQGHALTPEAWHNKLIEWCKAFALFSLEDPFYEEDFKSFAQLNADLAGVEIVGDDLFVTQSARIQQGIVCNAASMLLVKPNQVGSLGETLQACALARHHGMKLMISHRSGETEDPFIADLAYGLGADYLKTGALARSDRVAKYNRLLEIERLHSWTVLA